MTLSPYHVVLCIPTGIVSIGCKCMTPEEWLNLTEEQAKELDGDQAVEFYREHKDVLTVIFEKYFNGI